MELNTGAKQERREHEHCQRDDHRRAQPADPSKQAPPWGRGMAGQEGAQMGREGVHVITRPLRYRTKSLRLPDGKFHKFVVGTEKGIDIRIALDIIRFAHKRAYDVALVFSQDQDLVEAATELRRIGREQNRWLKIASAYPDNSRRKTRGIEKTDWIPLSRELYDDCLDPRDYRPKA